MIYFNYVLEICLGEECGISFGTYKDSNNTLTFNQSILSTQTPYVSKYQSKIATYTATYTKITESREQLQVSDYKEITIDLTNSYILYGKYSLKESTDDFLYDILEKPIFNKYQK